jgi:hypothetical protein
MEHPADVALDEGLIDVRNPLRQLGGALRGCVFTPNPPAGHQGAVFVQDYAWGDEVRIHEKVSHAFARIPRAGSQRVEAADILKLDNNEEGDDADH